MSIRFASALVHFLSGSHGSLLSPAATGGAAFIIANPGLLKP